MRLAYERIVKTAELAPSKEAVERSLASVKEAPPNVNLDTFLDLSYLPK